MIRHTLVAAALAAASFSNPSFAATPSYWYAAADSVGMELLNRYWPAAATPADDVIGKWHFTAQQDGKADPDNNYWHQPHAMDAIIDAYNRTPDTGEQAAQKRVWLDVFDKWFRGVPRFQYQWNEDWSADKWTNRYPWAAVDGADGWRNHYIDDMEWQALTHIRMYEALRSNEPLLAAKYLAKARELYDNFVWGLAWDDVSRGGDGGVFWMRTDKERPNSKNACSNGPAMIVAAKLAHHSTSEADRAKYTQQAEMIYGWMMSHLWNDDGAISDNWNDGRSNGGPLTYNQGTFLGGCHWLYKITGKHEYLTSATLATQYTIDNLQVTAPDGTRLLRSESDADETNNSVFRAIFLRYFVDMINEPAVDTDTRAEWYSSLESWANYVWRDGKGVDRSDPLFGYDWRKPLTDAEISAGVNLGNMVSGVALVEAMNIARKPATAETTPTSYSAKFDATSVARQKADYTVTNRPPADERLFVSKAIDREIELVKKQLSNPKLRWMFENCFPNTLDTTVRHYTSDGEDDTLVYTGDIHAMWLRDSGAQVWPYVQFAGDDEYLRAMIEGVIRRQFKSINIDPYANAFLDPHDPNPDHQWMGDNTAMRPELHERKWEIDSLCYPIRLAYYYWQVTGDASIFDEEWLQAITDILKTFREQQRKEGVGSYTFTRETSRQLDTMNNDGRGNPVNPVGLIASAFRPSDDATTFLFLVPSNFFAVSSLRKAAEILTEVNSRTDIAAECTALAAEVEAALKQHATYDHPKYGTIYSYEVDGFGNRFLMDDANVPSLLAMPYMGDMPADDPVYLNTRRFVWSTDNPYFFRGTAGEGIGGPHIGYDMAWPMSIMMRAFTSTDDAEIKQCVEMLLATDAETGFMHESFNVDNPYDFTRKWFAWQNTLFGELILKLVNEGKVDLLNSIR